MPRIVGLVNVDADDDVIVIPLIASADGWQLDLRHATLPSGWQWLDDSYWPCLVANHEAMNAASDCASRSDNERTSA